MKMTRQMGQHANERNFDIGMQHLQVRYRDGFRFEDHPANPKLVRLSGDILEKISSI